MISPIAWSFAECPAANAGTVGSAGFGATAVLSAERYFFPILSFCATFFTSSASLSSIFCVA